MDSYQHDPRAVLHWTVLPLGHMISEPDSSIQITVMQDPFPVASVTRCDVAAVVWYVATCLQVVVMVIDGVEAIGMVTVGATVGSPELLLPTVVGVIILQLLLR